MSHQLPTTYDVLQSRGVTRRDFLKYCALTAVAMGLAPGAEQAIAKALETKPRLPVLWINGLSCSCCTESFLRTAHPLAADIILSMIALDYQDTIMAAAGFQAEAAYEETIEQYKGNYILAVEGNTPLGAQGMYCIDGGKPFAEKLRKGAAHAKAIVAWGTCASWGCVQAAHPNPTTAVPVHKMIHDKPIIKVPGCPAIPDVMSSIIAYMLTYDRLPTLDRQGRPEMFYGKRVHDQCYRRAHFDAGEFVEIWDDEAARQGHCLYKMGCKGPTTYNACPSTRWNDGTSFPIQSGHGCLGCSEQDFWDQGSFYDRITNIPQLGTNTTAETVGLAVIGGIGAAVAVHGVASMVNHGARCKKSSESPEKSESPGATERDPAPQVAANTAQAPAESVVKKKENISAS